MATKVIHVSDVSGRQAEQDDLVRLIVHEHPEYNDLPVELEALPAEVAGLETSERFAIVEVVHPGEREGERRVVALDSLNSLGEAGRIDAGIQHALMAKHRRPGRSSAEPQVTARGRGTQRAAGRTSGGRTKVDYASLEHAGTPHRGRITEAEKEIVRTNLDKVNKRLRDEGVREIDPSDSSMKDRYGL